MNNMFMDNKGSNNLCNTYILPLVGCNKPGFGGNFVNSFVADDNIHVVVQLKQMTATLMKQTCYKFHFVRGDDTFVVYEIPQQLRDTITLFREGKYSKFSELAKQAIRTRSLLRYREQQPDGRVISAKELLALDKDPILRKDLEEKLQVKIDHNAELASIPGEECFFTLNLNKPELVS